MTVAYDGGDLVEFLLGEPRHGDWDEPPNQADGLRRMADDDRRRAILHGESPTHIDLAASAARQWVLENPGALPSLEEWVDDNGRPVRTARHAAVLARWHREWPAPETPPPLPVKLPPRWHRADLGEWAASGQVAPAGFGWDRDHVHVGLAERRVP